MKCEIKLNLSSIEVFRLEDMWDRMFVRVRGCGHEEAEVQGSLGVATENVKWTDSSCVYVQHSEHSSAS